MGRAAEVDRRAWRRHYPGMLQRGLLGMVCLSLLGCTEKGDGAPPSVAGEPAEQAAEIATRAVCDYAERCGDISITCADCGGGPDCVGCFAEHYDVEYAACTAEIGPDLATGFACEAVTPEEAALVDECLQALAELECPSIEEAEAWANGGGGENPTAPPEPCRTLEDIRFRCYDYGDPGSQMPEPAPG